MKAETEWLGLPIRERAVTAAALLSVLLIYALTASRDLSLYDSAELALVAHTLGLGHPPGQPLFTLVGFAVSNVPGVPPLVALNLMSAVCLAFALLPACSIAFVLARPALDARPRLGLAIPIVMAMVAMHAAIWEPATRVEVYPLATALSLYGSGLSVAALSGGLNARKLAGAGLAFGLAAGCNPYIGVFPALAVFVAVALHVRTSKKEALRALLAFCGCALLPLALYLYVPWVAHADPRVLVWGRPTTASELSGFFRGADYAKNWGLTAGGFAEHVATFLTWSAERFILVIAITGLIGYGVFAKRELAPALIAFVSLFLTIALVCANGIFHPDVLDYLGYLAAPLLLCGAGAAAGVAHALVKDRPGIAVGVALPLLASVALAPPSLFARTRSDDHAVRLVARGMLDEMARGSFLVVENDHVVAPLLYLQQVEHVRPDVVVIAVGLSASEWYWKYVFAHHADLQPMALRGPGGREGRLRRLFVVNHGHPIAVETFELAARLSLSPCAVGYAITTGAMCDPIESDVATAAIREAMHEVASGSPGASDALAATSRNRGEALFRMGRLGEAYRAFLAGTPLGEGGPRFDVPRGVALMGPLPRFARPAPLVDPTQNVFLAAQVALAAGQPEVAQHWLGVARDDGLPEALRH